MMEGSVQRHGPKGAPGPGSQLLASWGSRCLHSPGRDTEVLRGPEDNRDLRSAEKAIAGFMPIVKCSRGWAPSAGSAYPAGRAVMTDTPQWAQPGPRNSGARQMHRLPIRTTGDSDDGAQVLGHLSWLEEATLLHSLLLGPFHTPHTQILSQKRAGEREKNRKTWKIYSRSSELPK